MPTVSQLPAQLDAECVAGDPFSLAVTSSGATITSPTVTLKDALGATITGTVPTVSQLGAVTTVAFSAATTAALNTDTTRPVTLLWSLSALVNGQGPFQLVARKLTVWPVGTAGVSTATAATLAVTVGGAAVSLAVTGGLPGPTGPTGPEGGTSTLTVDGQILTRAAGAPAAITRAALAADPAFTSRYAPLPLVVPPINRAASGVYCSFPVSMGGASASAFTNGVVNFIPIMLAVGRTPDRIGIEVTVAGTASVSVHRLGIWADNGGVPGTLLVDAGTVATDSTGLKEVTISLALAAHTLYWLGVVQQGAPAATATLRVVTGFGPHMSDANPGFAPTGFRADAVTGALASNPTLAGTGNGNGLPRIFMRFT